MAHISREELMKLAKAANLMLTEEEMPALVERLESVLSYASYLRTVATESESDSLPHMSNVMRADEVVSEDGIQLLQLAPHSEENFFVVPVIIKQ